MIFSCSKANHPSGCYSFYTPAAADLVQRLPEMAHPYYRVTQMETAGPIHQSVRAETSLYYPILDPRLAFSLGALLVTFSKRSDSLSPGKNVSLVTQATSIIPPDTFLVHGMNFWLRLWTVRTAGFSNSFYHWFLHDSGKIRYSSVP